MGEEEQYEQRINLLKDYQVNICLLYTSKLITTSEIRITCAISSEYTDIAISEIAKEFNV